MIVFIISEPTAQDLLNAMQADQSVDEEDGYSSSDNVPLSTFCSGIVSLNKSAVPSGVEYPQVSIDYDHATFAQIQNIISGQNLGDISLCDSDVLDNYAQDPNYECPKGGDNTSSDPEAPHNQKKNYRKALKKRKKRKDLSQKPVCRLNSEDNDAILESSKLENRETINIPVLFNQDLDKVPITVP